VHTIDGCVLLCQICHGPKPEHQPGQPDLAYPYLHPRVVFHCPADLLGRPPGQGWSAGPSGAASRCGRSRPARAAPLDLLPPDSRAVDKNVLPDAPDFPRRRIHLLEPRKWLGGPVRAAVAPLTPPPSRERPVPRQMP
jgi:hypothetical protein